MNYKVNVFYPDGKGNHETTANKLRQKFENKGEDKNWINWFMARLTSDGVCCSAFAEYRRVF